MVKLKCDFVNLYGENFKFKYRNVNYPEIYRTKCHRALSPE